MALSDAVWERVWTMGSCFGKVRRNFNNAWGDLARYKHSGWRPDRLLARPLATSWWINSSRGPSSARLLSRVFMLPGSSPAPLTHAQGWAMGIIARLRTIDQRQLVLPAMTIVPVWRDNGLCPSQKAPYDSWGRLLGSCHQAQREEPRLPNRPSGYAAAELVQHYFACRSSIPASCWQDQVRNLNFQGARDCGEGFGPRAMLSLLNAGERHSADPRAK